MPSTMKNWLDSVFSVGLFFTMWSLATLALTEHTYNATSPIASEYKMTDLAQKTLYDAANLKYQDAAI
jgi:maltose/moltooligosaccharide transporter